MLHAKEEGNYLLNNFKELKQKFDIIGDVRGMGLFLGIEIVKDKISKHPYPDMASNIVQRLKEEFNILLSTDGPHHNVLKFKPPMVWSRENSNRLIMALNLILSTAVDI